MDTRLALMCGTDIPIPELQLTLHQPTIKEISYIGEQDFFMGAQALQLNKKMFSQGNSLLESTTNFQIFMTIMTEKETRDKKEAVISVFQILFPGFKITLTPRSILLNKENISVMIDENNFEILQEYIKLILSFNSGPMDQTTFNPADKKAQEIAEKLMRGRQRVAEQKGEAQSSVLSQYLSILTVGLNSMSLKDIMSLTIYQLYDLIERYMLYTNWDLDVRTRLAGGKPDSKPDNWMKNIH